MRSTQVWEDVFVGYALSQLSPSPSLGIVSIGDLYWENWGFGATPSTIVWHAKTKDASRPAKLHEYMVTLQQRCGRLSSMHPRCLDTRPGVPHRSKRALPHRAGSCTGGAWIFCVDDAIDSRCKHPRHPFDLRNKTVWQQAREAVGTLRS